MQPTASNTVRVPSLRLKIETSNQTSVVGAEPGPSNIRAQQHQGPARNHAPTEKAGPITGSGRSGNRLVAAAASGADRLAEVITDHGIDGLNPVDRPFDGLLHRHPGPFRVLGKAPDPPVEPVRRSFNSADCGGVARSPARLRHATTRFGISQASASSPHPAAGPWPPRRRNVHPPSAGHRPIRPWQWPGRAGCRVVDWQPRPGENARWRDAGHPRFERQRPGATRRAEAGHSQRWPDGQITVG